MDKQQKLPARPSGIPRLASRLPLPTSTVSKSIKPSPSRERLRTDTGVDAARLRRPSEETLFKKPLPKYSVPKKPHNGLSQRRDVSHSRVSDGGKSETDSVMDGSLKRGTGASVDDADTRGRTRPSLSERTIETLSQIPPSPGSSRHSSFFNGTSPMRSPSRPASVLSSCSRSPSRSSSSRQQTGGDFLSRPSSAMRLPSRSRQSLYVGGTSAELNNVTTSDNVSKLKLPSSRTSTYRDTTHTLSNPGGSSGTTSIQIHDTNLTQELLHVKKTRKTPTKVHQNSRAPITTSRSPSTKATTLDLTFEKQSEMETRKTSKSSTALRETIAKAKAARKAAMQNNNSSQSSSLDDLGVEDPFNQRPKDPHKGLLGKRLEAGRTSGHLNIAAMSLAALPEEVMAMYDFDPDSVTEWYESVDIVKFIAADNEFVELPDSAFPDLDPEDPDADERGNQFGGLEILDLHGNLLRSLPIGFRRLQRLHTLNLSNNKLSLEDIQIIMEMGSVKDLKLAKNQLQGAFLADIKNLHNLEVLDLHGNSLTELPDELAYLTSLRILNVGDNHLSTLPFEGLSKLSLKELSAPNNRLKGTLFPASVQALMTLQSLDVTGNALTKLSDHDTFGFPNLHTLAISLNRIQCLPDVSSWHALLSLSAEDNSIADLPPGFAELTAIRNVDLTGNNISKLDERIGLMESLVTFRISNNPLRERKYLNMSTEDLKRELRNRCEPELQDTDDEEGSVATQFTLAPEAPAQSGVWQVKPGGVVDRSYADLQELDMNNLERINPHEVRCLYLQHNELRCIPAPTLSMLAPNLTDLDLSHNPLDSTSLLATSLDLPSLQILNLSATGLTTLEPLLANLRAPSLTFLDVSNNRICGSLPPVRQTYPSLMTFLAADNRFDSLDFDAIQGLQVLDIGNNNINSLPPKLGLLRAEGCSKNWGNGSALKRFEIAGNSFRVPRWQIVAKGTDAILEWLKDRIPAEDLSQWEPDDESST
ncbi:conserved leucine-rich repeat protein [Aspergillus nomiae NRRL 13137]|uniref:Conserved leucine-rich repeat protein n=1 Tax=Aspergillus nomiae NRRL (strain ATCC 15546 / NRRL 13137 / CBS 260.88 / M93) TaxID=1509407 RepID=A0A0L1ISI1_ASPN3|nr:conserved leucine-rich repeat protein [Aspergillus nomiae NRRL 13137]KNG82437.1 conserved leucine-rich repeat protein [Aspergillus nomiae NRRL 13137]